MSHAIGDTVIVRGVGSGEVVKIDGYIHVRVRGHVHPYMARPENVTGLATPLGKGDVASPDKARLMKGR